MKIRIFIGFFVGALSTMIACSDSNNSPVSAPTSVDDWIAVSDRIALQLELAQSAFFPENGSAKGLSHFDKLSQVIRDKIDEQLIQLSEESQAKLQSLIDAETNPDLLADLNTMKGRLELGLQYGYRTVDFGVIPFSVGSMNPVIDVYGGLASIFLTTTDAQRHKDAIERFRRYVHGFDDVKPLAEAYASRIRYVAGKPSPREKIYPSKQEVEAYFSKTPVLLFGIKNMLKSSHQVGWEDDFALFERQVADYGEFVRSFILPRAWTPETEPPQNKEYENKQYLFNLLGSGVTATPEELVQQGLAAYQASYPRFLALVNEVAAANQLPHDKPDEVMKFLRSKRPTNAQDVLELYKKVAADIEHILTAENLITVPTTPLRMRLMTTEESALSPVPHLNIPPLLNNRGETPEFLMPVASEGLPYEDFISEAGAYGVLAHEGRPGHDLQVRRMLGRRLSSVRKEPIDTALEGWAKYAEGIVQPFLPKEARLVIEQMRLGSMARMFLEPQIFLGKATRQDAFNLISQKLGFSEQWANVEADRIAGLSGQMPAYYFGYLQINKIKGELKSQFGSSYSDKCFHDAFINAGWLPLPTLADYLKRTMNCAEKVADPL